MKCPNCKLVIDCLICERSEEATYKATPDGESFEYEHITGEEINSDYKCPNCKCVIAETEEQALAFINGDHQDILDSEVHQPGQLSTN